MVLWGEYIALAELSLEEALKPDSVLPEQCRKKADMVPCSFLRYPTEYAPLVGTGMNLGERRVSINKIFWKGIWIKIHTKLVVCWRFFSPSHLAFGLFSSCQRAWHALWKSEGFYCINGDLHLLIIQFPFFCMLLVKLNNYMKHFSNEFFLGVVFLLLWPWFVVGFHYWWVLWDVSWKATCCIPFAGSYPMCDELLRRRLKTAHNVSKILHVWIRSNQCQVNERCCTNVKNQQINHTSACFMQWKTNPDRGDIDMTLFVPLQIDRSHGHVKGTKLDRNQ